MDGWRFFFEVQNAFSPLCKKSFAKQKTFLLIYLCNLTYVNLLYMSIKDITVITFITVITVYNFIKLYNFI